MRACPLNRSSERCCVKEKDCTDWEQFGGRLGVENVKCLSLEKRNRKIVSICLNGNAGRSAQMS